MKTIAKFLASLALAAVSMHASATTDCTSTVSSTWTGLDGTVIVYLQMGSSFVLAPTDAGAKIVFAQATSALMSQKNVLVRYSPTGVACTSGNYTLVGMFMYN